MLLVLPSQGGRSITPAGKSELFLGGCIVLSQGLASTTTTVHMYQQHNNTSASDTTRVPASKPYCHRSCLRDQSLSQDLPLSTQRKKNSPTKRVQTKSRACSMAENTNANLVFSADSRLSSNNPSRRALGEVSPNVRQQPSSATMLNSKPLTGSPLKRSFTAAMEGGQGFQYLKRRKLSIDSPLSQVHTAAAPVITQPLPQWSPALPLQEVCCEDI